HHHRAARLECFFDELMLPAGGGAGVGEAVLAYQVVGVGEAGAGEAALARPLPADEDDQFRRHGFTPTSVPGWGTDSPPCGPADARPPRRRRPRSGAGPPEG